MRVAPLESATDYKRHMRAVRGAAASEERGAYSGRERSLQRRGAYRSQEAHESSEGSACIRSERSLQRLHQMRVEELERQEEEATAAASDERGALLQGQHQKREEATAAASDEGGALLPSDEINEPILQHDT